MEMSVWIEILTGRPMLGTIVGSSQALKWSSLVCLLCYRACAKLLSPRWT